MLLKFKAWNYICFAEEVLIDLEASNDINAPQHMVLTPDLTLPNFKVLPVIALFGANASGKTYILHALSAMITTIVSSSRDEFEQMWPKPFIPFAFDETKRKEPSGFEIILLVNKHVYKYGFEIYENIVVKEYLYYVNILEYSKNGLKNQICLYNRNRENYNITENIIDYSNVAKLYENLCDEKTLFLSMMHKRDINIDGENPMENIFYFAASSLFITTDMINQQIANTGINSIEWFQNALSDTYIFDNIKKFFQEYDNQIIDIIVKLKKSELSSEQSLEILSVHRFQKSEIRERDDFPFDYESDGSKKLLFILPDLLRVLREGGLLFVDELDSRLHPLLLKRLLQIINDPNYNTGKSQVIFSSHNPTILDARDLRIDAVWFVEKNRDGISNIYSLYDYYNTDPKLRKDDYASGEWGKDYLLGRYGAIPYK